MQRGIWWRKLNSCSNYSDSLFCLSSDTTLYAELQPTCFLFDFIWTLECHKHLQIHLKMSHRVGVYFTKMIFWETKVCLIHVREE